MSLKVASILQQRIKALKYEENANEWKNGK
jgi:hypothetical protein